MSEIIYIKVPENTASNLISEFLEFLKTLVALGAGRKIPHIKKGEAEGPKAPSASPLKGSAKSPIHLGRLV